MAYLYRVFLNGILTLLPVAITVYLLVWIATSFEAILGGPLRTWLPDNLLFPGIGVVLGILFVLFIGLLVNNYVTHPFINWVEKRLAKMPIVRSIYNPLRDVTQLFATNSEKSNQRVVMIDCFGAPIPGSDQLPGQVLGLVTRDNFAEFTGNAIAPDSVAVFIPFSYAMGGFTVIVPKSKVREVSISAEKAMQLALTAWIKATDS